MRRWLDIFLVALAALFVLSPALFSGAPSFAADEAPPFDVRVTLEPPVIPFHRQARYTISVEGPDGTESAAGRPDAASGVKLPDMLDKFGGLSVADVRDETTGLKKGRFRVSRTYVLDPIFIGNYRIQPVQVTWGLADSLTVPSPALRVRDLTPEEKEAAEKFADIAGPLAIKNPLERYWMLWAGVGGAAVLVLAVAAYFYRRRAKKERQAPPLPPWEIAYQRLRELDQRQLPKDGKFAPYYVDLSAILRYYIEDRFHLRAPEQTTPEFLVAASGSGVLTEQHQGHVAGFLKHCDRVKFAQYVPSIDEMEHSFTTVLQFVDETVPVPAPAEREAAA